MADRIIGMRSTLFDLLKEVGSKKDWKHIKSQIGMFAYLVSLHNFTSLSLGTWGLKCMHVMLDLQGITPEQVDRLAKEYHVYLTRDGRISVAGITDHNVRHLAESLHEVTKNDA